MSDDDNLFPLHPCDRPERIVSLGALPSRWLMEQNQKLAEEALRTVVNPDAPVNPPPRKPQQDN